MPRHPAAAAAARILTLALAAAPLPAPALAGGTGALYVFGDSSADTGAQGIRFTNRGPMWVETVARRLGREAAPARWVPTDADGRFWPELAPATRAGGTNYAVGGATSAPVPGQASFADQLAWFREDHAGFGRHDLTLLWMGSNDAAEALLAGRDYDPAAYAAAYLGHVRALKGLGARDIVVMNEPERLLPVAYYVEGLGVPAAAMEWQSAAIAASNRALAAGLAGTDTYVLDLNRLADDILARPKAYGFTATTAGYMTLGDPRDLPDDGNVFADNHYSVAMQAVVADFALAQLAARDNHARLAARPLSVAPRHLAALERQVADAPADGAWHLGGEVSWGRDSAPAAGTDPGLRVGATGAAVTLGRALSPSVRVGARLAASHLDGSDRRGGLDLSGREVAAAVHLAANPFAGATVGLSLLYGRASYGRIERRTPLGVVATGRATGETDASMAAARVGVGYTLALGDWALSPGAALTYVHARTDGYAEATGPISLVYGDATATGLRGMAGLRLALAAGNLRPHLGAAVEHEFRRGPTAVRVGPTADLLARHEKGRGDRDLLRLDSGLSWQAAPGVTAAASVSAERDLGGHGTWRPQARLGVTVGF